MSVNAGNVMNGYMIVNVKKTKQNSYFGGEWDGNQSERTNSKVSFSNN